MAARKPLTLKSPGDSKFDEKIQKVEIGLKKAGMRLEGKDEEKMSLSERMAFYKIPNVSIAVIEEGKVEGIKTYGGEATPETRFQAGSISKPVAAFLVLKLVEEKKITLSDLNEDVNKIFERCGSDYRVPYDEKNKEEKVTLRRLLSHTAGLSSWF